MREKSSSWDRVKALYREARGRDPEVRSAFLDQECKDAPELRAEVEELLAVEEDEKQLVDGLARRAEWREGAWEELVGVPEKIGPYQVVRRIADGGMGAVFEAMQEQPRRTVAIKVMRTGLGSPSALKRFEYESQVLAYLKHPGIAQVLEVGSFDPGTGPVPFFSMEYVEGARSITDHAEQHHLTRDQRIELFAQVCEAVHHGHTKGVIHRDLKPSNILVDEEGRPKIIDFGVARSLNADPDLSTLATQPGQLIGTLQYMSPEQCRGDPGDIDTRSDLYALGVVLYELLAGKTPYDLTPLPTPEATRVVCEEPLKRPSAVEAGLRGDLETILLKALEKQPERRYPSAQALADDLRRFGRGEAIQARPATLLYQLRVLVRRNRALTLATAVALLALTGGFVAASVGWLWATAAEQRAVSEAEATRAALDFLGTMLAQADPTTRGGEEATYRSLLDESTAKLDGGALADKPLVESAVRAMLAEGYVALGLYEPGEVHLAKAVTLRSAVEPPDDPDLCALRVRYALALRNVGRSDDGEVILHEVLAAYERAGLSTDDGTVRSAWQALGAIYLNQKRMGKAEAVFRRLVDADETDLAALTNLSLALRFLGRSEDAEPVSRKALEVSEAQGSPLLARVYYDLATVLRNQRRFGEAEVNFRAAVRVAEERFGRSSPDTVHMMSGLAWVLCETGKLAEAEGLLVEVLAFYHETLGERAVDAAVARSLLGHCLTLQARFGDAERELKAAHDILSTPGASGRLVRYPPPVQVVSDRLADLYEAWGKPLEAAKWRGSRGGQDG